MFDSFTVEEPGLSAITDLGRNASLLGLSRGGALDQLSARLSNALVGNHESRPVLELLARDIRMRAARDMLLVVTGAEAQIRVDGTVVAHAHPFTIRAGELLQIGHIRNGVRCYLAVRGGFASRQVLGSCAPDAFIGLGHSLEAGDVLVSEDDCNLGQWPDGQIQTDLGQRDLAAVPTYAVETTIGPHIDRLEEPDQLYEHEYRVSHRSNNVGIRVSGTVPKLSSSEEVKSSGVPIGAVEITSGDELLILHRGRGVTAGYSVAAVATSRGLNTLAQVSPGQVIRFVPIPSQDSIRQIRQERIQIQTVMYNTSKLLEYFSVEHDLTY